MPNPPPQSQSINTPFFVSHIDVLLLVLFALYVALTLPRSLVRLFQHSEILNGYFLRSGTKPLSMRQPKLYTYDGSGTIRKKPIRLIHTLTSPTVDTLVDIPMNNVKGQRRKGNEAQPLTFIIPPLATTDIKGLPSRRSALTPSPRPIPTRVLRWMRILRLALACTLNFRVAPGISLGNLLVFLVYTALILYASLCHSNPITNPQRTGYLAISQVPIAVALAGKTNWLGLACGIGYEKVCVSALEWLLCSKTSMVVELHPSICGTYHHRLT